MADAEHVAKLKRGVDVWNNWRQKHSEKPDFKMAFLPQMDLEGVNLSNADLRFSNLDHSLLNNANFDNADLSQATFDLASMEGVSARNTRLHRVNLGGAQLEGSVFRGANFAFGRLYASNFTNSDLRDCDLSACDLRRSTFNNADITGSKLWDTHRTGWHIAAVKCEAAFWDESSHEITTYKPQEFERLYTAYPTFELRYPGGISFFELNTLPLLIERLSASELSTSVHLQSMENVAGGMRVIIAVGTEASREQVEELQTIAHKLQLAQLEVRSNERLADAYKEQLKVMTGIIFPKLNEVRGMTVNMFGGTVGAIVQGGQGHQVTTNQGLTDFSGLLQLIAEIQSKKSELPLSEQMQQNLEVALQRVDDELRTEKPNKRIVEEGLRTVRNVLEGIFAGTAASVVYEEWVKNWVNALAHALAVFS